MLRSIADSLYERRLRLQCHHVPRHIAIIQDGNRRFARMMKMQKSEGHRLGADRTEEMLDWASELGIRYITLYSFSTENFNRESEEVKMLFELFRNKFTSITSDHRVHKKHIRVQMVGDRSLLPADLLQAIEAAEASTEGYSDFYLNIALAYGGRNEIVRAARDVLQEVYDGRCSPEEIDPARFEQNLHSGRNLPPVDLIIRTGNEYRTSNFLPWLANGHECVVYFCAPYWPMFRKIDLLRAIRLYSQRVEAKAWNS